jgi:SAM-dependent methyltransferase
MRVLDAGCGGGRNLIYFLRCGYDVCGVDLSTEAIRLSVIKIESMRFKFFIFFPFDSCNNRLGLTGHALSTAGVGS